MKESLTMICPVKETAIKFITQSPQPLQQEFLPASDLYLRGNFSWEDRGKTRATPHNPGFGVHSHGTGHAGL